MLVLKNYTADSDGDDNFSHLEDRRKQFAVKAIRMCNARPKVRQQDKYSSSFGIKKDKYQIIKFNLTGS